MEQLLKILDKIAVSITFPLSIEMSVTTQFKKFTFLRCHLTPTSVISAAPRNLETTLDLHFSGTLLADSFSLS